jgi:hypothetical protein
VQEEKNLTSVFPGCIGLRVNLYLKGRSQQILRLAPTIFSYDRLTGILTLSCATPGATIKYTLDGSFPAADIANNPSSFHYTGPFYVDPGITVRAAAW